ncbi:hypothetical protein M011DRAFT_463334 [Sporormia fimetaria CBS 119925]|uniref:Uncharacterized protein n=1 Tax=Sporormia fimetaria CBS 119925 TaxID=1340428 RepID=A0A6A6VPP1_9PLEO|nr:hypothetical protein M011DRAFT_463334 [Sporormia fimetaria CBS 119925]
MSNSVRVLSCSTAHAASNTSQTIVRHYTRLLQLWPKDALRPNQPFTKAIEHRALPYGVKPLSESPAAISKNSEQNTAPAVQLDSKVELDNIRALYSLLDNKFSKKYPITQAVLKPTSNPKHYDRLMQEIERAPKKSWLQGKIDEWKMKIRWQ